MPSSPDSWQSTVERALAGAAVDDNVLIARASAASGALADAKLLQFIHIALVQALAKSKQKNLDKTAAAQLLSKLGASPPAQIELAKGTKNAVAACIALTSALGEVVPRALANDANLVDQFAEAYERLAGTASTKLAKGTPAHAKLKQVQEAFDADLINEAEALALKERVLASL